MQVVDNNGVILVLELLRFNMIGSNFARALVSNIASTIDLDPFVVYSYRYRGVHSHEPPIPTRGNGRNYNSIIIIKILQ